MTALVGELTVTDADAIFGVVLWSTFSPKTRELSSRAPPLSNPDLPNEASTFAAVGGHRSSTKSVVPPRSVTRDKSQMSTIRKLFKSTLVVAVCVSLLWVPACVRVFLVVSSCMDFCGAFPWFFPTRATVPNRVSRDDTEGKAHFQGRLSSVEKRLSRPAGGAYAS